MIVTTMTTVIIKVILSINIKEQSSTLRNGAGALQIYAIPLELNQSFVCLLLF